MIFSVPSLYLFYFFCWNVFIFLSQWWVTGGLEDLHPPPPPNREREATPHSLHIWKVNTVLWGRMKYAYHTLTVTVLVPVFLLCPQSWSKRSRRSREERGISLWGNIQVGAAPHRLILSVSQSSTREKVATTVEKTKFTNSQVYCSHCWTWLISACTEESTGFYD